MKVFFILLALTSMSVGCIRIKSSQDVRSAPEANEDDIQRSCRVINETGNIFELLRQIKFDTRRVITLVSGPSPADQAPEIERLAQEVHLNSDLVMKLAQKDWNYPVVTSEINWRIQDKDLPYHPRVVRIKGAEVLKIFFQGSERADLKERLKIILQGPDLLVSYKGLSTLLEHCQFNETLMIVLEVRYRGPLGVRSKFFNLYVKPGERL